MHHHILGVGTLAIIGAFAFGPQAVSAIHDMTSTPDGSSIASHVQPISAPAGAQAMLQSAIDSTFAAAQTGRIDSTLDAFSTSLQRNAHIPDSEVNAILDAAQGPEGQQFLRTLALAVKDPSSVSMPQSAESLTAADRAMIVRVQQSVRTAAAH